MKNFSDAEIGITRSDLQRIIEDWYNRKLCLVGDDRRIKLVRLSPDAKYVVRFNVLSPSVTQLREADASDPADAMLKARGGGDE